MTVWILARNNINVSMAAGLIVRFDHGLPRRVKNMARGTQQTKTEAEGRGFCRYWVPRAMFRYWVPRAMFFTRYRRPWSNPIIARSLIDFFSWRGNEEEIAGYRNHFNSRRPQHHASIDVPVGTMGHCDVTIASSWPMCRWRHNRPSAVNFEIISAPGSRKMWIYIS